MKKVAIIGLAVIALLSRVPAMAQEQREQPATNIDLKELFANPPKGYGNVPFYWWNGDSLTIERLKSQLQVLSESALSGLSVSYMHTHPRVDTLENANGYGSFGRADGGIPEVFSEQWWQLWEQFARICFERGIGLGIDDYVLGWAGNGFYVDELLADSAFANYQGRLRLMKKTPPDLPQREGKGLANLTTCQLQNSKERLPQTIVSDIMKDGERYIIYTEPSYLLHPDYGKRLIDVYFHRFEERMSHEAFSALNYFFQDELQYPLTLQAWSEDMPEEFLRRKGYDVRPYLLALFRAPQTEQDIKIRLDYAEVVTQLAEERYFQPIFEWHHQRGLIYGCDNTGRGLNPTEYLDYFRVSSWYTAPGNDAPARGSSFRQTKVSSSVAHLYQRPRTWLEAFHSMGWSSNGQWLTRQLDHHLMAGGNLLCMHGLYYSTHGTWWEWAPPCFHFRMPYWPHMQHWLKRAERLCFLLSQGRHVCDVAVLYPTETLQAFPDTRLDTLWNLCDSLTAHGIDYDFVDYQSLQKAEIQDGELCIGDEQYQVLLAPIASALHAETARKIKAFGQHQIDVPDFSTETGSGKVLHRRIGETDVYMVMDIKPGDRMFFRAKGRAECWNPWDGSITELPVDSVSDDGTWICYTGDEGKSQLIVFSQGEPLMRHIADKATSANTITIDGEWTVEIMPTMDNRWGDFRLPASDEQTQEQKQPDLARGWQGHDDQRQSQLIGVEAREANGTHVGYAPYMETCIVEDSSLPISQFDWEPYEYSWQYGVKDAPGSQGYHGLKGKVDDRFMILDRGERQCFRTSFYADSTDGYQIVIEGNRPSRLLIDGRQESSATCRLKKGWHKLFLEYAGTKAASWSLDAMANGDYRDTRERSAVVFYHTSDSIPAPRSSYGNIVSMRWYGTNFLPYDPTEGKGVRDIRFSTAPGAKQLKLQVAGRIKTVRADGVKIGRIPKPDASGWITIDLPAVQPQGGDILLRVVPNRGFPGASALIAPVKILCGEGVMEPGNWSDYGALKYYSGGIRYTKQVTLDVANSIILDLGEVDATCEVSVNGCCPQIMIDPPYRLDITPFVRQGENSISVLVYSSLSNHYQSTPSPYRGKPHAGLIGPVTLTIQKP